MASLDIPPSSPLQWHDAQLPLAHPLQPPPPPLIAVVAPVEESFENEANAETSLRLSCLHFGQRAGAFALLKDRSRSNLVSQLGQQYS